MDGGVMTLIFSSLSLEMALIVDMDAMIGINIYQ